MRCFLEVSISWAGGESGKGANLGGGGNDLHEAIYFELQMGKLMGIMMMIAFIITLGEIM